MWEKRMHTCVCDWVTLLYRRKLTEHCKSVIIEKIKIIIKLKKNCFTNTNRVQTKKGVMITTIDKSLLNFYPKL